MTIITKMVESKALLDEFLDYYPIYQTNYRSLLTQIQSLAAKLTQAYQVRYVKKQYFHVHPRLHPFLQKKLYEEYYLRQLKPQKLQMTLELVKDYLMQQPANKLHYLLEYVYDTTRQ